MSTPTPTQRFDNTITALKNLGNARVANLAECIRRGITPAEKERVGRLLHLGYYSDHSDANKRRRHLVRGSLLLRAVLGGADNRTLGTEKTRVQRLADDAQVTNDITGYITGLNLAVPTAIQTGSLGNGAPQPDAIRHVIRWGCSSGAMIRLAYVATREMVYYRYFKFTHSGGQLAIPIYGDETGWNRRMFAPWWPELHFAPDNPSTTRALSNGMVGEGTDNHYLPPQGPHADAQVGNFDPKRMEETEVWAEQVYQYNATGDPATWDRDPPGRVSPEHPNDAHWTDFSAGKWLLKRKIYKGPSNTWYYELRKQGNEPGNAGQSFLRTCPVKGPDGQAMKYA